MFAYLLLLAALALAVLTAYYGAIVAGWLKEPMMAHFRRYGEERRVYPLPRFMRSLGGLCLLLAPLIPNAWVGLAFVATVLMMLLGSLAVDRREDLRRALPRWYFDLLQETTREERRAIAWAWLRLPLKTRIRLNGDQYAFRIFIDEVRLTVTYGARDPDDPWAMWQ